MKRFYTDVTIEDGAIRLDGRIVKTPDRAALSVPYPALATAIAAEWRAQGDVLDPRSMPMTGLANAAIDRVAPDPPAFVATLAGYAETDLLCYRALTPPELLIEEKAAWDPLLDWARARYDVHFEIVAGIVHCPQPPATVARLREALTVRSPFALAAMAPLITISGSLVTALAIAEGAIDGEPAFEATHLDEIWQARRWGEDALATQTRDARRRDFTAAARFLQLLD
ncbi:ATP12 family protein [Sphingomonas sp. BIUV-7]|uniref:ATP12 family protein n=1 Tax=Sphingomonas natans TaxID=3063330 RepID=A0ABT8YFQ9_9SPHN|nr:ATP12 family protein [Sphingomonas sp. BIUV-7]MDO6416907.1 ATP12 family protein [Sphingomonas sp. BIUV-7]